MVVGGQGGIVVEIKTQPDPGLPPPQPQKGHVNPPTPADHTHPAEGLDVIPALWGLRSGGVGEDGF